MPDSVGGTTNAAAPSIWDRLNPFQSAADDVGQTGQASQSALDAYTKTANGMPSGQDVSELPMEGAGSSPMTGVMGGLGMLAGGINVAHGISEVSNGQTGQGVYDIATGALGFGQGAISAATPFISSGAAEALGPVGGAFGALTGGMQMGKGLAEATSPGGNGGDAAFDLLQGGANATAGVATMAGAMPVAAVAGAGALGMTVGNQMAHFADSDATKDGSFGVNADTGQNQSAMDWGASAGTWVDTHIGDRNAANPSILGGIAAAGGGIAGGIAGTAKGLWDML